MNMQKVNDIAQIDLEGFQVVKGEYFLTVPSRMTTPTMTIKNGKISFSKRAITDMNSCERIRMEVNPDKRSIIIIPVTAKDMDAIRWTKNIKEPLPRVLTCSEFTSQIFELWGWDEKFDYRAVGRVVTVDNKVMMLFDFNDPEKWRHKERGKKND